MPLARDPSGALRFGGLSLAELVHDPGTPAYVYDVDAIAGGARALGAAFDGDRHLVAYAIKANAAGRIVRALALAGCGADVVSGAELRVAVGCGIEPGRIVYSGVAKTDEELDLAIGCGPAGIGAVQIESIEEVARVSARARALGRKARVSLRVNPSLDLTGATHANIATGHDQAKFGVPSGDVLRAIDLAETAPGLDLVGLSTHAGSQFMTTEPYRRAARMLFGIVGALRSAGRGRSLSFVNTGGGFGVDYTGEQKNAVSPADFVSVARSELREARLADLALYIEPGRSIVAPHGLLLARVIQSKVADAQRWLMIDAGMNDLLRPALYQARHRIVPVEIRADERVIAWRVVGPVCESSDDFGAHDLPLEPPCAVAILDAGAYGYSMASQYNGRRLPVEVFVSQGRVVGVTQRAAVDGWADERVAAGG
ncbi:MAG: diaminopimelate decarboxylase [Polyangiaceae bacterium]|jgi:diaminopimelate decarboxylase